MTSTALPPLPSIRAKELEKRVTADSVGGSNEDAKKSESAEAKRLSGSEAKDDPSRNADLHPNDSNVIANPQPYQPERKIYEKLDMLRHKEQKAFSGVPSLESSVACNVIHQYISTTSSFLNSFIADANASHEGIDHKISVLEKQMALLESKIASIPDLLPEEHEGDDETKEDIIGKDEGGETE